MPISTPDPVTILRQIHAVMCNPFDWSADTPDAVAEILANNGFSFPDEATLELIDPDGELLVPIAAFDQWRPAWAQTIR